MIKLSLATPGTGPGAVAGQLWATVRAELVMQWRRWGLWLAFGVATILIGFIFATFSQAIKNPAALSRGLHFTQADYINYFVTATTTYTELVLAVVAALLVADRVVRDRLTGMVEIQRTTTQAYPTYVAGKFIGNLIAVLVPAFIACMLCALELIVFGMTTDVIPAFAWAFVLVYMPAFAVVVALTLFLASILPLRVVQVGFPLLWLYSTLSPLRWQTIHDTIFSPSGRYIFPIFFPTPFSRPIPGYTSTLALLNISALVGVMLVSLVLLTVNLNVQNR